MQRLQVLAGLQPELLDQLFAGAAVDRERVGLPALLPQGAHEQAVAPLAQRVLDGQRGELGYAPGDPAQRQVQADPLLQQRQPQLAEPAALALGEGPGEPGERFAPPLPQGLVQQVAGLRLVAVRRQRLGPRRQLLGLVDVQRGGGERQPVAVAEGGQHPGPVLLRLQDLAPAPGVGTDGGDGCPGRVLAPQRVHQIADPGRSAPAQQQHRQHRLLLRGAQGQGLRAPLSAHRAEQ